jgi:diguanylate cyclase (GGDEF)-like protein
VELDYSFAVRQGETTLYSILTRVSEAVPESTVHAALTYYSTEDAKGSFLDFINDNIGLVVAGIGLVVVVILVLLLRDIRAERKAREEHHKVEDLNKRVFVDALTSVRNKGAYSQYIGALQTKLNNPLTASELAFAIAVFDCDDLKAVNDGSGHDKGDEYLKAASKLICRTFQHCPVFRIGGDEFAVILQNEDYDNREALIRQFEQSRAEISAAAEHPWERVNVSMGLAVFDPETDPSVIDVARRADKLMYENKRARKEAERAVT